jgi:ABC-type multidrug transport system fused ATPase/permease subunit
VKDFFEIYSFGGFQEKVLMIFGIIIALGSGVIVPLFMYYWGKQIDHTIQNYTNLGDTLDEALQYYLSIIGLAVGSFAINGLSFSIWKVLSERIAYKFRVKYI